MLSAYALDPDHVAQCLKELKDNTLPERKLLIAVLIRGIADALNAVGRLPDKSLKKTISREAWAWVVVIPFYQNPRPFSFQWICEELDLCPHTIQKNVIAAKRLSLRLKRPGGRNPHIVIS